MENLISLGIHVHRSLRVVKRGFNETKNTILHSLGIKYFFGIPLPPPPSLFDALIVVVRSFRSMKTKIVIKNSEVPQRRLLTRIVDKQIGNSSSAEYGTRLR